MPTTHSNITSHQFSVLSFINSMQKVWGVASLPLRSLLHVHVQVLIGIGIELKIPEGHRSGAVSDSLVL